MAVAQPVCCAKNNCSRLKRFSCKNVKKEVKLHDLQKSQSRFFSATDDITGSFSFLCLVRPHAARPLLLSARR